MQYNLPRHGDHHVHAGKPFWLLATRLGAPVLPYGYQTLTLIALIPPLWHRNIDPLLADWDRRFASDAERDLLCERHWTIETAAAA